MKLSILMPVYNERSTLASAVKQVLSVDYPCDVELVIVDDGSTDGTRELYAALSDDPRVSVHLHPANQGKGAAIRTASEVATGDYVIMCDADLEYAPAEIPGTTPGHVASNTSISQFRGYRRPVGVAIGRRLHFEDDSTHRGGPAALSSACRSSPRRRRRRRRRE